MDKRIRPSAAGILKPKRHVSFSTFDQTSDFYINDPPVTINETKSSIRGSSALAEMLGFNPPTYAKREVFPNHQRKVFRLTAAIECEPEYVGERRVEAAFSRDHTDVFSGNDEDPNGTVAVIHFGQDFRDVYCSGTPIEPRDLQVTISYSKKSIAGYPVDSSDESSDEEYISNDNDSLMAYFGDDDVENYMEGYNECAPKLLFANIRAEGSLTASRPKGEEPAYEVWDDAHEGEVDSTNVSTSNGGFTQTSQIQRYNPEFEPGSGSESDSEAMPSCASRTPIWLQTVMNFESTV